MILYIIKANFILALLCLLFQVLMHRDTFFGVRRLMLWGIYLTAFLLPLWNVQAWMNSDTTANAMATSYAENILPALNVTAMRVAAMGVEQSEPGCGMWFVGTMMLWALIYLIPVAWMTAKLTGQIAYIIYLRCTCPLIKQLPSPFGEGAGVRLFPRPCSPFSFGPWIFIHPDGMDEQTLREVLIHEQTHVRQWHTLDVLFSQLVCILFWWNPAAWVMRREVRMNLEFLADAAVIGRQTDKREYQYRLLGFTTQKNVATIANNFNVLPLKRRITMMNLKRTSHMGMAKYALFVPVAAAMLLLSNIDSLARSIAEEVKKPLLIIDGQCVGEEEIKALAPNQIDHITVLKEQSAVNIYGEEAKDGAVVIERKKNIEASDSTKVRTVVQAIADVDDNIYANVDQMPEYPGGMEAMNQVLYQNVRYPAVAHEHGIQGMVMVNFIVEKDGTLSSVKATEVCDVNTGAVLPEVKVTAFSRDDRQKARRQGKLPENLKKQTKANQLYAEGIKALKAESERVVRLLPERWKPGRNAGQPVRVLVTLPVTFKMQ